MDAEKVLEVAMRELEYIGSGWRADWNDFDGRTLQGQIRSIREWAVAAIKGTTDEETHEGLKFARQQYIGCGFTEEEAKAIYP